MIQPGKLRERLHILRPVSTRSASGAIIINYVSFFFIKAEKINNSGSKTIDNKEIFNNNIYNMRCYSNSQITNDMRVIYNNCEYNIQHIENDKYYNEMILTIEKINK